MSLVTVIGDDHSNECCARDIQRHLSGSNPDAVLKEHAPDTEEDTYESYKSAIYLDSTTTGPSLHNDRRLETPLYELENDDIKSLLQPSDGNSQNVGCDSTDIYLKEVVRNTLNEKSNLTHLIIHLCEHNDIDYHHIDIEREQIFNELTGYDIWPNDPKQARRETKRNDIGAEKKETLREARDSVRGARNLGMARETDRIVTNQEYDEAAVVVGNAHVNDVTGILREAGHNVIPFKHNSSNLEHVEDSEIPSHPLPERK